MENWIISKTTRIFGSNTVWPDVTGESCVVHGDEEDVVSYMQSLLTSKANYLKFLRYEDFALTDVCYDADYCNMYASISSDDFIMTYIAIRNPKTVSVSLTESGPTDYEWYLF